MIRGEDSQSERAQIWLLRDVAGVCPKFVGTQLIEQTLATEAHSGSARSDVDGRVDGSSSNSNGSLTHCRREIASAGVNFTTFGITTEYYSSGRAPDDRMKTRVLSREKILSKYTCPG